MSKNNTYPTSKSAPVSDLASKFKVFKVDKTLDLSKYNIKLDINYQFCKVVKTDGTHFITRGSFGDNLVLDVDESIFSDNEKVDYTNKSVSKFRKNFGNLNLNLIKSNKPQKA